jgi:hypothetical protein
VAVHSYLIFLAAAFFFIIMIRLSALKMLEEPEVDPTP